MPSPLFRHTLPALVLTLSCTSLATWAADPAPSGNANAAPNLPPPNPAAEQAVRQHFQTILAALEGKTGVPDAKLFTEEFNEQVNSEQMKTVLSNVHQSVGSCKVAAQMRSPVSYISGYLLQCDKAYVPIELGVEEKAPYRVQSLLIRPGFWKP
jgi:uncharacterized protein (UPF0297 family)